MDHNLHSISSQVRPPNLMTRLSPALQQISLDSPCLPDISESPPGGIFSHINSTLLGNDGSFFPSDPIFLPNNFSGPSYAGELEVNASLHALTDPSLPPALSDALSIPNDMSDMLDQVLSSYTLPQNPPQNQLWHDNILFEENVAQMLDPFKPTAQQQTLLNPTPGPEYRFTSPFGPSAVADSSLGVQEESLSALVSIDDSLRGGGAAASDRHRHQSSEPNTHHSHQSSGSSLGQLPPLLQLCSIADQVGPQANGVLQYGQPFTLPETDFPVGYGAPFNHIAYDNVSQRRIAELQMQLANFSQSFSVQSSIDQRERTEAAAQMHRSLSFAAPTELLEPPAPKRAAGSGDVNGYQYMDPAAAAAFGMGLPPVATVPPTASANGAYAFSFAGGQNAPIIIQPQHAYINLATSSPVALQQLAPLSHLSPYAIPIPVAATGAAGLPPPPPYEFNSLSCNPTLSGSNAAEITKVEPDADVSSSTTPTRNRSHHKKARNSAATANAQPDKASTGVSSPGDKLPAKKRRVRPPRGRSNTTAAGGYENGTSIEAALAGVKDEPIPMDSAASKSAAESVLISGNNRKRRSKARASPPPSPYAKRLNDRSGFHYLMSAPISLTVRAEDDRLTYMNKGQFYEVTLAWNETQAGASASCPCPSPAAESGAVSACRKASEKQKQKPLASADSEDEQCDDADLAAFEAMAGARPDQACQSVIIVTLRDLLSVNEQLAAWQFWHSRQQTATNPPANSRIIEFASDGLSGIEKESVKLYGHNALLFKWFPKMEPAKIQIALNCLSTDFSSQKGVKGYSLHLQIDTFLFDSSSNPVGGPSATIATGGVAAPDLLDADSPTGSGKKTRLIHRAFCQVKVFSEKGAERKARSEDRRRNEFLAGPRAFVERFASAITTPSANNAAADTTTTTTTLSTTTGGAAVGSASNRDEDEEEGASSDEAESSKKDAKTASLATALSASGLNSPSTIANWLRRCRGLREGDRLHDPCGVSEFYPMVDLKTPPLLFQPVPVAQLPVQLPVPAQLPLMQHSPNLGMMMASPGSSSLLLSPQPAPVPAPVAAESVTGAAAALSLPLVRRGTPGLPALDIDSEMVPRVSRPTLDALIPLPNI